MNTLTGNVVTPDGAGFGEIRWEGEKIVSVTLQGDTRPECEWILPGFIDLHFHGLGDGDSRPENLRAMVDFAPRTGMTSMAPALGSDTPERTLAFVREVRNCCQESGPGRVRVAGSHLEGPFIELVHRGGMQAHLVRSPDTEELKRLLEAASGTLRIMTLAPELPGAGEVMKLLSAAGVQIAAGHTAMTGADLAPAIAAGVRQICHLFDAWDGREVVNGVPTPAVMDLALIEDRLMLEVVVDGVHVPPPLVELTLRAAGPGRIVAITDALRGAGLPDGTYTATDECLQFTLRNDDACRVAGHPEILVGSCLTMNRAFYNLVHKFGATPVAAALMTSANAAKCLKIDHLTGKLLPGLDADITVLAPDQRTVVQTIARGVTAYKLPR